MSSYTPDFVIPLPDGRELELWPHGAATIVGEDAEAPAWREMGLATYPHVNDTNTEVFVQYADGTAARIQRFRHPLPTTPTVVVDGEEYEWMA